MLRTIGIAVATFIGIGTFSIILTDYLVPKPFDLIVALGITVSVTWYLVKRGIFRSQGFKRTLSGQDARKKECAGRLAMNAARGGYGRSGPEGSRITSVVAGIAIAISVTALVLALWPVIAEAPWEVPQTVGSTIHSVPQTAVKPSWESCMSVRRSGLNAPPQDHLFPARPAKLDCCSYLTDLLAATPTELGARVIVAQGARFECWQ